MPMVVPASISNASANVDGGWERMDCELVVALTEKAAGHRAAVDG